MKSLVGCNEENILRKRKYDEVVKESNYKTLKEVFNSYPEEFTPNIIDKIPLKTKSKKQDDFTQTIDVHGSVKKYTKSVFNPLPGRIKRVVVDAENVKGELGLLDF